MARNHSRDRAFQGGEPRPGARRWGRRLLGALLLFGTVTLVSCQSVFAAFSPGLYE